jgi:ferrous iron transport protein B
LFIIYTFGIFVASVIAKIFNNTLFKAEEVPFVMELPPYRVPTMNTTITHMWNKGGQYLKKMGGVILVASILIWGLSYYPVSQISSVNPSISQSTLQMSARSKQPSVPSGLENSYIGKIGRFFEPVMQPLGFDWKMSVSLLTGIAAKEVVVSTMGVLYNTEVDGQNGIGSLIKNLREEKYTQGKKAGTPVFTPVVAASYMIFILLYFPCVAVIAAIKKESGSWKWAAFTIFYTTGLAWIMSFIVYQTGNFFY